MDLKIFVMDTETTGFDPQDGGVVEVAAVDGLGGSFRHTLVNPGHPISPDAKATHHITEKMVRDEPTLEDALQYVLRGAEDNFVTVWHNAEFDLGFMPEYVRNQPYICTWRCSMHLWPTAPNHKNGALWYWLNIDHEMPEEAGNMPHRALFDSLMTRDLFLHMLRTVEERNPSVGNPIDHLIWMTAQPVILDTVRFGKHRGLKWSEVPIDYLSWMLRQKDVDQDVAATCRYYLENVR